MILLSSDAPCVQVDSLQASRPELACGGGGATFVAIVNGPKGLEEQIMDIKETKSSAQAAGDRANPCDRSEFGKILRFPGGTPPAKFSPPPKPPGPPRAA